MATVKGAVPLVGVTVIEEVGAPAIVTSLQSPQLLSSLLSGMMPLVFEALVSAQSCTYQVFETGVVGKVKVAVEVKFAPGRTTLSEPGAVYGTLA
jgi:hypothetical protein